MKLTKQEKAWVRKVNEVLAECPSERLGFFTIGDPFVGIYDRKKHFEKACAENTDLVRYLSQHNGLCDLRLEFPGQVESVCG